MRSKVLAYAVAIGLVALTLIPIKSSAESNESVPTAGKSYLVRNKQYGKLLRPQDANSADGIPIVLYPAQIWKCMTWKFNASEDSQFSLQNHFTSKTFAAKPGGDPAGAAVIQVPFGKTAEGRPLWQIARLKDGTYKIADKTTGKVLSAQKSSSGSGVKILLQAWTESDNQKWELQEIDPAKLTM